MNWTMRNRNRRTFDGNLRLALQREMQLFFESILHEDRSIIDLLDADYTFVDERLARHYGIPNVKGSLFRRVTLAKDDPRRGIVGKGSVLLVTSAANRTSPVQRGQFILENILGAKAPNPPPGVEVNLDKPADATESQDAAAADGIAPSESGVQFLPQHHGSHRVHTRKFRSDRKMARYRLQGADR